MTTVFQADSLPWAFGGQRCYSRRRGGRSSRCGRRCWVCFGRDGLRCLETCMWTCQCVQIRAVWPENQGSEITCLEDTAKTMLRDAVPQREYVNEKRNPQTETPERADKDCSLPRWVWLGYCYQIPEQWQQEIVDGNEASKGHFYGNGVLVLCPLPVSRLMLLMSLTYSMLPIQ